MPKQIRHAIAKKKTGTRTSSRAINFPFPFLGSQGPDDVSQPAKAHITLISYPFSNKLARVGWLIVYLVLFRFSPRPCHAWRSFLLRCFGARIGKRCHIYGSAKIWAPWNLICHRFACIADGAEIYNPVNIILEEGATVSQGAFLCSVSHDYTGPSFPIIEAPITVGSRAWVAARAIVLMGVHIGEGSVIGAGSVVTKDVPPYTVCAGNPARVVKEITK